MFYKKKHILLIALFVLTISRVKKSSSQSFRTKIESLIQSGKNLLEKSKQNIKKGYEWVFNKEPSPSATQKDSATINTIEKPLIKESDEVIEHNKLTLDEKQSSKKTIEKNVEKENEKNIKENEKNIKEDDNLDNKKKLKMQILPLISNLDNESKLKIKTYLSLISNQPEYKNILDTLKKNPNKKAVKNFFKTLFGKDFFINKKKTTIPQDPDKKIENQNIIDSQNNSNDTKNTISSIKTEKKLKKEIIKNAEDIKNKILLPGSSSKSITKEKLISQKDITSLNRLRFIATLINQNKKNINKFQKNNNSKENKKNE